MSSRQQIIQIALKEHDEEADLPKDSSTFTSEIMGQLDQVHAQSLTVDSSPLSLVTFECMLQDTGYPLEVYLPPGVDESDMSQLKERWVGWAVEIPGSQHWSTEAGPSTSPARRTLPEAVRTKYPIPAKRTDYLGALVKIYEDVSFKPASKVTVTGILSTAVLPGDSEDLIAVPAIHVLRSETPQIPPAPGSSTREEILDYLSSAFSPSDPIAAELLLLNLISSPLARPTGQDPLGTLSINFISPKSTSSSEHLISAISSISPHVVPLPLSVSLLHSESFAPKSTDSASLDAGLLQLAEGTVLAIQEGEMGEGGQLNDKAVRNLQTLVDCIKTQTLRYEYPYMDGLKMDCAIRAVVFSEGKSLIPVDLHVPIQGTTEPKAGGDVEAMRQYLAHHARKQVVIPDEMAQYIQDDFVAGRQGESAPSADVAGEQLKRKMKIVRLLAQSHDGTVTPELWIRASTLEAEVTRRMSERSK